jgi:hypothetical protein
MSDPVGGPTASSHRARVVVASSPAATVAFVPQPDVLRRLLDGGLLKWTGRESPVAAWERLLPEEGLIGIKVHSAPGGIIGTRPALVEVLLESLLQAGIPAGRIVIWDKFYRDLLEAGFVELGGRKGVAVSGAADAGWDENVFYENALIGKPVWGDHEFGRKGDQIGRRSYFSRLVTGRIKRHLVVTPMLNHRVAGVAGTLMSMSMGSVDNSIRFENRPAAMAEAAPEIFGRPVLFDRLALVIVDGLICQYQGEESNRLHYATMLNQLRFSTDPVALDVLSLHELEKQRKQAGLAARVFPRSLYENAELLELGVADPRRIVVETVATDDPAAFR